MKSLLAIGILLVGSSVFANTLTCRDGNGQVVINQSYTGTTTIKKPTDSFKYEINVSELFITGASIRSQDKLSGANTNGGASPNLNLHSLNGGVMTSIFCGVSPQ